MKRLKKNDLVQVIAGRDRGRSGKIVEIYPKEGKCIVEGAGTVKKHQRASQQGGPSGIVEKSSRIHLSNVMPVDSKTKQPSRVRIESSEGGKQRKTVKSGQSVESAEA